MSKQQRRAAFHHVTSANGAIIYRGPSLLDGKPIVAIVTGLKTASANAKTGDMLQTWILREDIAPHVAIKTGDDEGICGDCRHRGEYDPEARKWIKTRTCYVQTHWAPRSVYAAYHRGIYPDYSQSPDDIARIGAGRVVRRGAYGDPMAAPLHVWSWLVDSATGWTGYTHQWRSDCTSTRRWQRLLMASADNEKDRAEAFSRGWRTFRVTRSDAERDNKLEVLCPASKDAGHRSTCAACKLCMGTTSQATKSIAIPVHGAGAGAFRRAA